MVRKLAAGMIVPGPLLRSSRTARSCGMTTASRAVVVDPGGDVDRILCRHRRDRGVGGAHLADPWSSGPRRRRGGVAGIAATARWRPRAVPIEGRTSATNFCCRGLEEQGRSYGFAMRNVTPDRWLREGDSVALGEHRFDVLHCPGHTPGHVVFVNQCGAVCAGGRCAVPGLDWPYRFSLRRPCRADPRHQRKTAAIGRRSFVPVRPRPRLDDRGRAADQSVLALTSE